jgi:hypothetical protein
LARLSKNRCRSARCGLHGPQTARATPRQLPDFEGRRLRLGERLQEGATATLHFTPAEGRPMDVEAIVWRSDDDGPVFFFLKATPVDFQPRTNCPRQFL